MRPAPLVATIVLAAAAVGCSSPSIDFERMRQQRRADPYGSTQAFADGSALRTPPAGTVGYEPSNLDPALRTGIRAGRPITDLPLSATPDVLSAGQHAFQTFCVVCHAEDGSGRAVMSANMPGKPVPSLLTSDAMSRSAGELFEIVTRGKDRMPAYDWALPAAERWAVVAHVQRLQRDGIRTVDDSRQ